MEVPLLYPSLSIVAITSLFFIDCHVPWKMGCHPGVDVRLSNDVSPVDLGMNQNIDCILTHLSRHDYVKLYVILNLASSKWGEVPSTVTMTNIRRC